MNTTTSHYINPQLIIIDIEEYQRIVDILIPCID